MGFFRVCVFFGYVMCYFFFLALLGLCVGFFRRGGVFFGVLWMIRAGYIG